MNLAEYEELLEKTAFKYDFETINLELDPIEIYNRPQSICFLRHDVDYSLQNAVKMAELEKNYGVRSTYTVLLSCQNYNPFEKNSRESLKKILSYGHEVGLHFDPTVYNITNENELDRFIKAETSALEDLLEARVSMFSFHNTTDFSMSCRAEKYGGLINAYSDFFHDQVEYTSDSNGYWRFRSWRQLLLEGHKVIQILTHPIWWQPKNDYPPFETIIKNTLDRADVCISVYTKLFVGQNSRINHSFLDEWMLKNNKINDPDILNSYAQLEILLDELRSGVDTNLRAKLHKVIEELKIL